MILMPRIWQRVQRSPRARRLMSRLRRQSTIDRVLSWVEDERPDLKTAVAPDGTVTILFTDIESSTELNERLGDGRWFELLRAHNDIVRDCVREHSGYVVKAQGDGFMIAYPSAREALECAIEMERRLAGADQELSQPLRVRIGIHTGEAIKSGDDFYGRSVTLAARIGDEAKGGEILASSVVRELVDGTGEVAFEDAGVLELKGLRGKQHVYRVPWDDAEGRSRLRAVS